LLEHGANPNVRDPGGMTVAHVAAGTGNLALMRHLVRRKANLTVVTPETNETVLMVVAKSGAKHPDRIKIAELVLGAGAPIDHRDASGNTALVDATAFGDIEMVKFLMSRNASADVVLPSGFTPAAIAVEHNNPELLQLFISKRAGLNARVEGGLTLIQYAEKLGHRELADMLRRIDRS
jgi:ankyrin repeat protein